MKLTGLSDPLPLDDAARRDRTLSLLDSEGCNMDILETYTPETVQAAYLHWQHVDKGCVWVVRRWAGWCGKGLRLPMALDGFYGATLKTCHGPEGKRLGLPRVRGRRTTPSYSITPPVLHRRSHRPCLRSKGMAPTLFSRSFATAPRSS